MSTNEKGDLNKMSDHLEGFESVLTAFFNELKKEDFDKDPFVIKDEVQNMYESELKKFLEEKKVNDHSSNTQEPYDKLFEKKYKVWRSNE